MPPNPYESPKKRRWLRYSLRSFLVVLTVGCLLLGYWVHRAERQKAVVKWVEENGGAVTYDFEFHEKSGMQVDAKRPYPEWFQEFPGDDYFASVRRVELQISNVKNVLPLAHLDQLEVLFLDATNVRDLVPLEAMTNLSMLSLNGTKVSDLTPLARLRSLKELHVANTDVFDVTPLAGMTSIEFLDLSRTDVTNVKPLTKLTNLESLEIYETKVTQEEIDELKAALPNCKIDWSPTDKAAQQK